VIETIGLNDKTFVHNYRTPHSGKLHVTERWKLIDGGNHAGSEHQGGGSGHVL
jgi:hypothetical protein